MTSQAFEIESDLESRICADPEWRAGAESGVPFRCDDETGTKRPDPWESFARLAARSGEYAA